jgi:hypothetical protein
MAADGVDIEPGLWSYSDITINEHSSARLGETPQPAIVRNTKIVTLH